MQHSEDGGPAFPAGPYREHVLRGYRDIPARPGMTLRDWFAGVALTGMLSGETPYPTTVIDKDGEVLAARAAREAYIMADAMLEARKKTDAAQ